MLRKQSRDEAEIRVSASVVPDFWFFSKLRTVYT